MDVAHLDQTAPMTVVVEPTTALDVLRRLALVGMVVALCVCSLVPIFVGASLYGPSDDVYITLAYARSLSQGYGFRAFPDAQPSLGTTTPLNAIVIALISRLVPMMSFKDIAVQLSIAMWIATGWLWALSGTRLGLSQIEALCIGLLILLEAPKPGYLGFEFKFFFLVLSIALIAYAEKRHILTGILCGIAFLIRGEAILLLGALGLHQLLTAKIDKTPNGLALLGERLLMLVGGFAIVFSIWAAYAKLTIGEIFPTTLQAKLAQVIALHTHATAAVGFIDALTHNLNNLGVLQVGSFQFTLWLMVGALGFVYAAVFRRHLLPLVLWGIIFAVGYSLLNTAAYPWYSLQLDFILVVLSGLVIGGVFTLTEQLAMHIKTPALAVLGAIICGALFTRSLYVVAQNNLPTEPNITPRTFDLMQLAAWVNEHTEPGSTVAHHEVGLLQWYSNRRIIDLLGLLTPEVVPTLLHYGATLAPAFEQTAPDYWIDNRSILDPTIRYSDYFIKNYMLVDTYKGTEGGQYYMYRRGLSRVQPTDQDIVFDPKIAMTTYISDISYDANGLMAGAASLDPTIEWYNLSFCAADYPYLIVDVSVADDVISASRFLTVWYASQGQPFSEARSYRTRELSTNRMQRYIIDTKLQMPLWGGMIDKFRFDPLINPRGTSGKFQLESVRLVRSSGPSHCGQSIADIPTTPNDVMLDFNKVALHQVKSAELSAEGDYQVVVENDPWLVWNNLNLCAEDYPTMLIDLAVPAPITGTARVMTVYYAPTGAPLTEERSVRLSLRDDDGVHQYAIDLSTEMPDWAGWIGTVRVDPVMGSDGSEPIVIKQIRLVRSAGDTQCK